MSGMMSNSPRRIFNKWDDSGLPALKNANTDGVYVGDVIVSAIDAGETHIGEVGIKHAVVTATIILEAAAYAALDVMGSGTEATGGFLDFVGAARVNAGGGVIRGATFVDLDKEGPNFDLILYSAVPGTSHGLDNDALLFANADANKVLGVITAGTVGGATSKDWITLNDASIQFVETCMPFTCATGKSLFGEIMAQGVYTPAGTGDLKVRLLIEQG